MRGTVCRQGAETGTPGCCVAVCPRPLDRVSDRWRPWLSVVRRLIGRIVSRGEGDAQPLGGLPYPGRPRQMVRALAVALSLVLAACTGSMPVTEPENAGGAGSTCFAASYEASKTSLYYDTGRTWAVGYADFSRDGREDVLMGYVSRTTEPTPIKMFLQDPNGELIEDGSLLPPVVPGTVHARKVVIADLNSDGIPDAVTVDHGYDQPPFPGAKPILLISSEGRFEERPIPGVPAGFQHSASAADLTGDGQLEDVSYRIAPNKAEWSGGSGQWVPWITLRDWDGDGHKDIAVANKARSLVYLNDGHGVFTEVE